MAWRLPGATRSNGVSLIFAGHVHQLRLDRVKNVSLGERRVRSGLVMSGEFMECRNHGPEHVVFVNCVVFFVLN